MRLIITIFLLIISLLYIFVKVRKNSSLSRKDKNVVDLGGFADRLKNKMQKLEYRRLVLLDDFSMINLFFNT